MTEPKKGCGYVSLAEPDPTVHFAHLLGKASCIAEIERFVDGLAPVQQVCMCKREAGIDPQPL